MWTIADDNSRWQILSFISVTDGDGVMVSSRGSEDILRVHSTDLELRGGSAGLWARAVEVVFEYGQVVKDVDFEH